MMGFISCFFRINVSKNSSVSVIYTYYYFFLLLIMCRSNCNVYVIFSRMISSVSSYELVARPACSNAMLLAVVLSPGAMFTALYEYKFPITCPEEMIFCLSGLFDCMIKFSRSRGFFSFLSCDGISSISFCL